MKAEREFVNQPTSVGQARRFVMDALSDVNGDALEDAAVMVSELASNCLRHAATSFTGTGSPLASRASTQRATAVLRPLKEKSKR